MKMFGAEKHLAPIASGVFDTPMAILAMIFGKRKVYYSCPSCKSDIRFPQEKCSDCGVNLDWDKDIEWKN